jgi:D-lactate dehydrogenase
VAADLIIIIQAANTGLTGGSTPEGSYDRPVVIISTTRLTGIYLLNGGEQAVCLAGSTLYDLERKLTPLGREPHSVIGSSCIGASVVGGICNNSGGALIRRGPAYTEYALFARVAEDGGVSLHNNLGIRLGNDPESILQSLQDGRFTDSHVVDNERAASARDYERQVRDISSDRPARFNADPTRLFEASGSAGRVVVFAVRVDTFPADERTATFYIGTNDPTELSNIRCRILRDFRCLPISGEYIHRTAFDLAVQYGKDVFLSIELLGTHRLPALFSLKSRIDRLAGRIATFTGSFSDRVMQSIAKMFPQHLPKRMTLFRDQYEHHLILKTADDGVEEARRLLSSIFPSQSGDMFECSVVEARKAFLHRFSVASAAIRYRNLHRDDVKGLISLDIALPRNAADWFENLPAELSAQLTHSIYYGHFFCHVFHHDYLVRSGCDVKQIEEQMLRLLDQRGAECPAEHNVGHLYQARPALADHYRRLDPRNVLNPGIGKTARNLAWAQNAAPNE